MKRLSLALLLCIFLLAAVPVFAQQTIGLPVDPGTGNCFPFGCAYSGEYQQVYTSSAFSGPLTITDLEFFNTQETYGSATAMNSGTWTISLSTTAADWNTLSGTFADNLGANNTEVFSGNLTQPWALGDTLTINLTTPFTYDPGDGNLLMDVMATDTSQVGGYLGFDTNGYNGGLFNGNTTMGRVYCNGCSPASVNSGYGLVTGFDGGQATVPEPSVALLLGPGLVGLFGAARRRMRK
jgi:hypothetical protein